MNECNADDGPCIGTIKGFMTSTENRQGELTSVSKVPSKCAAVDGLGPLFPRAPLASTALDERGLLLGGLRAAAAFGWRCIAGL